MVPANYFEIFHDHDAMPLYDTPKSARTTPTGPLHDEADGPLYDFPPELENLDRDYDLPPSDLPDYDRPPSSNRSSVKSSSTSLKLNRLSGASGSSIASNPGYSLYDVPPDLADVYNIPKSTPLRGFDEEENQPALCAIDISSFYDDQAEELLTNYRQLITGTYENLFQSVYGPDAYWGSDNKPRRTNTLLRTSAATKQFDRALIALLEFGKGAMNTLESSSSDANFKRKYTSAFRALLQKRSDILNKLDSLGSELESITATVKSLLEVARTVPSSVTEFTVLVQANKALLFKTSAKDDSLPVITKNEVKSRPLPELPVHPGLVDVHDGRRDSYDYASIAIPAPNEPNEPKKAQPNKVNGVDGNYFISDAKPLESSLDFPTMSRNGKRNPNDNLPPLPYATMNKPTKPQPTSSPQHMRTISPQSSTGRVTTSPQHTRAKSPQYFTGRSQSPMAPRTDFDGRKSPRPKASKIDVDNIDAHSGPAPIRSNRPSTGSGASRGSSPLHRVRRPSIGSMSNSSDEPSPGSGLRRFNSAELLENTPYGRPAVPNGFPPRASSPMQPLRQQDRELLERFSKQMDLIVPSLRDSVEVFLDCLNDSEPPKDFVTKGKLAVVAAYKLVYIADALSQKILHNETKVAILASSNLLTESIKNLVSDTKTAALQFPSVIALDRMGESLRNLYPAALDLVASVKTRSTLV